MDSPIVYVDLDGVLAKFPKSLDEIDVSIAESCRQWCVETGKHHSDFGGIFSTFKTIDGADEAIQRLENKFQVYLLSTAPWNNTSSWSDKRIWVEQNLPSLPEKRLILSHNKSLVRGSYLIDDRERHGAEKFGDYDGQEWIHFGSKEFPDWESVLKYLGC